MNVSTYFEDRFGSYKVVLMPSMKEILEYKSSIDMMPLEELEARLAIKSADAKYQDWQYELDKTVREAKWQEQLRKEHVRQLAKNSYAMGKKTITVQLGQDDYFYPCDSDAEPISGIYLLIPPITVQIPQGTPLPLKLKTRYDSILEEYVPFDIIYPEGSEKPMQAYVFRRNGRKWDVSFRDSKPLLINDLKGMLYIEYLLKRPYQDVKFPEFVKNADSNIEAEFKNLPVDSDNELFISSVIDDDERMQNLRGGYKKVRDRVWKCIDKALQTIKPLNPDFTIHFTKSIKHDGLSIVYEPENRIIWE